MVREITHSDRKQQCNVYLPPELVRRAKHRALDDQTSLSDLMQRALELHLAREVEHD